MQPEEIAELFQSVPDCRVRRMFGGQGIYDGAVIIALVAFDTLFLKTDAESEPTFIAAGCSPFVYEAAGRKPVKMPYYSFPPDAFDDPELAEYWIGLARAAGHRSFIARPARKPRGRKSA